MSRRRVVVTGMGMVSPLGNDVPSTWQGILAGRSGIGLIEHTDLSAYSTRFGGSIKGFEVEQYLPAKEARKLDLFIQYGLAASFQAVRDSGLEITDANRERVGVAMGSGIGGLTNIENSCRALIDQGRDGFRRSSCPDPSSIWCPASCQFIWACRDRTTPLPRLAPPVRTASAWRRGTSRTVRQMSW